MAAITTMLAQTVVCSGRFIASKLHEAANTKLVTGLVGLLKDAEPGSGARFVIIKTLIGVVRSKGTYELIRGWLYSEEVPTDLTVDMEVRQLIVATLARRDVFDEKEITAELERDNTNTGAEHTAGTHSSPSTPETKAKAWRLATVNPDAPSETHRGITIGFVDYGQEDVLILYVDAYVKLVEIISECEGG